MRQEHVVDEHGRRITSVIATPAMKNELLRERIRRMENEKPFLRWKSKRGVITGRPPRGGATGGHGCSRRGACRGLPSTSRTGTSFRLDGPPGAVWRRTTRMTSSPARSGVRFTCCPSKAKATARIGARPGLAGARTSRRGLLRLLRRHELPAHLRQPQPAEPKRHEGTIVAGRPNQRWGGDAVAGFPVREGEAPIFAMFDYWASTSANAARGWGRWSRRQVVREKFGGFRESLVLGIKQPHDHGSQLVSDEF